MSELVTREDRNGAAILTLNRPEKCNALNKEMFEALERHLDKLARAARTVGLVVLRGAGGNFSAGYDMHEVLAYVRAHAKPHFNSEVIEKLATLPQPVISAVQGNCSTGALELALAADLIVAAHSARFSDAYSRWGLTPIWGLSLRLPQRIGSAKAREMMYTCRSYSGTEAHEMHLANFLYEDAEFEAGLEQLAADILANSWYANQLSKRALQDSDGLSLREAHALEIFKNEGLAPDAQARVAAFCKRSMPKG
ncbi:MAG: enoyl-CoA hydratase/isomerase family protein [Gammaproteobacteria bacterium]|nr:enoyl-CoA hydratase/isomerase family protein [Gammaproteobacteria bacterium]MBV9697921.1 enoyl-CoA hydratase/isomerase family protein [Gammaproteobacteria bacterium]